MPDHLRVFVDESGDPGASGTGKGTRWLVFAGIAGEGEGEALKHFALNLRQVFGQRSGRLRYLHFAKLSGAKKLPAFMQLAKAPMQVIVVAADTAAMPFSDSPTPAQARYRYTLKFMLERASWLAAQRRQPLELVIEESLHVTVDSIREYVTRLRNDAEDGRFVDWRWVDEARITMARKDEQAQLWLADGAAHAFFQALETNRILGGPVPIYADLLQPLLWQGPDGDRVDDNGFAFVSSGQGAAERLMQEFPSVRRWVVQQQQVTALFWRQGSGRGE